MKKRITKIFASLLALVFVVGLLASCSKKDDGVAETTDTSTPATSEEAPALPKGEVIKIKVGASPTPHAEILESIKADLLAEGVDMEIVQFSDYVQPNLAVADGDLDANFFQHFPYLVNFNEEYKINLVNAGSIHFEPLGIFAGKIKSIDELQEGAKISVPNDATNEARALLLLQEQGIIKLKDGIGLDADNLDLNATKQDIVENPKNVDIIEMEAAQLPNTIEDVDLAVINGNYALAAGLDPTKDALAFEGLDSSAAETYFNVIAVNSGDEVRPEIQALVSELMSEKTREFIEGKYPNAVIPVF